MEKETIEKICESAESKRNLLKTSMPHYLLRAMLAGAYIGFALVLSFTVGQFFYEVHSPATYVMTALFFGIAFILIVYGGGELFTSNTMYLTISTMKKVTSWKETLLIWLTCYGGNVLGILFFTLLLYFSGVFQTIRADHLLLTVAEKKMTLPTSYLFFRAIFANWLVCLAVWLPLRVKGDTAKMIIMMLLVFTFFTSGYEHSIANIAVFLISFTSPHPEMVNLAGFFHNLIPVTLGNIVGGGFFVGMLFLFLNEPIKRKGIQTKPDLIAFTKIFHDKL
ncbi:formate/nitrite transporter family protein [Bacillus sp. RAR_GA_16]|uniref:formate/nitrite transporter family protein n=1 Tax=Bacillus sp. RAR_GA_16 TaxID=2876774 RepID=UPI001CCDA996|nr:formate/nitrite transporter family protein [Bacillus sp. RAR_GA_16]MCA0173864.1 formate/nitrite transporter family protein [Bacillus sp. RAR_GA_16]